LRPISVSYPHRYCGMVAFEPADAGLTGGATGSAAGASGAWLIPCPSHCWPHQQRPSGSMMQVPLPQQRGSSVMRYSEGRGPGLRPWAGCSAQATRSPLRDVA